MPYRLLCIVVVVLFGLMTLIGCGGGDNGPGFGQVKGHIYLSPATKSISTTDTGTHAVGAEIFLLGTSLSAQTDANGFFLLTHVPAGTHTLLVTAAGYQSTTLAAPVTTGKTLDISTSTPTPITRKWMILVYMNADNDLEQFGMLNMNQMESAPSNDNVSVVVQMARSPMYDTSDGNWSGTRRYLVQHDTDATTMHSLLLQDMGSIDMGQPTTLHDFIAWGQQTFPAEHYLVVVWDHGSGVLPSTIGPLITRGVSFDSTYNSFIHTIDLNTALTASPAVDVVAFDTCETQMAEIAYQIRSTCQYIVASEGDTPGSGYPYQKWLTTLATTPSLTPRDLAVVIEKSMGDYYPGTAGVEQAVIDTSQLDSLATAVDTLAGSLISVAGSDATQLAAARYGADHYAGSDYRDLLVYTNLVKASVTDTAVQSAVTGVATAVHNAVIAEYHANDHPNVCGLSIYLPDATTFTTTTNEYRPLAFSQRTRWADWIAAQQQ